MTKVEAVIAAAEIYSEVSAMDCDIAVCDADARLRHRVQPRTFTTVNIRIGDVASGGPIRKCLQLK